MNILVTGSKGFVGQNLIEILKGIKNGKNNTRPNIHIDDIFEYDTDTRPDMIDSFCRDCDFVFNLAGVNRTEEVSEFMEANSRFVSYLLNTLKKYRNACPVMFASSIQASLVGRYEESDYGKSKLAGEELFFEYASETKNKVLVYRFPNLFGKWCRPNYNSVVATFCNAVANNLEYTVNNSLEELELVYIDDLINEMLDALEGKEHRCDYDGLKIVKNVKGCYCYVPIVYHISLGEIVKLLNSFKSMPHTLTMPEIPEKSFASRLYSMYLSYLPESKISYGFKSNIDSRGSFTELLHTVSGGQVSINVAKPGITRGQHWHNSKWEIFIVVSGHGLIQERRIGINPKTGKAYPIINIEVTGNEMRAIQILPGYIHNITNLSETEDLVTVMWANERFDSKHPDTFYEKVEWE